MINIIERTSARTGSFDDPIGTQKQPPRTSIVGGNVPMCELLHGTALRFVRFCNSQAQANRSHADAQHSRTDVRPQAWRGNMKTFIAALLLLTLAAAASSFISLREHHYASQERQSAFPDYPPGEWVRAVR